MAGQVRILIVEDNPDDAELVAREIRREVGAVSWERVDTAEGLRAALARGTWDAVISDFAMPSFSGLEALEILRASDPDIPFILVSGTVGEETAVKAMKAGAADYVMKDRLVRLGPALANALRQAKERRARRQAEEALRQAEQRMRLHFEQTPLGVVEWDIDFRVMGWNPAAERIFGYRAEEALGRHAADLMVPPHVRPHVSGVWEDLLRRRGGYRSTNENITKDGRTILCEWYNTPLVDAGGNVVGVASLVQDVTERREAEERIRKQIDRLAALRQVDIAITGSLDIRVALSVLLDQVTTRLGVDAAAVLLHNPHSQTLEYASGRGFRTRTIERSRVRVGEDLAGRAALERRLVHTPDLSAERGFVRHTLLADEGFVGYAAAPLVAKGEVRGVLEVFSRYRLDPDPDWLAFLEALGGQAAIAIDNASLFEGLQRANLDLVLAYDATLEGWSRALDLRDRETEGHTVRVTETTVRLARRLGVLEADLVHVRRGALLHDMGKMGIPDAILLKPGPLTDEEWVVMRRHPTYAFEMLSPIAHLQPALDIPYCHHEKWDGTGYPRGLRGEQIPLAARIFAVVDVWDALRSDRPYRPAWSEAQALAYIREQTGQHFDPRAVEAFLDLLEEDA